MLRFVYPGFVPRGIRGLTALVLSAAVACSNGHAGSLPTPAPASMTASVSTRPSPPAAALTLAATTYYRTLESAAAHPDIDLGRFERLVSPRCECVQVVSLLRRVAHDRHRLVFDLTLSAARVARVEAHEGTVFIRVKQSVGKEVDAAGRVVRRLPSSDGEYTLDFVREGGSWLVTQITRTAS